MRRHGRWTAWAAASLAAHAAVLVAVASSISSTAPVPDRGPVVISVQWVAPAPAPSVPKPAADPATKTRTWHRPTAAPVPARTGRHALPAPSRKEAARHVSAHAVDAPDPASSPSQAAASSRHDQDLVRRHLQRFKFYPESARRRGIGGDVGVGFRLTAGGHVAQVRITASSGYALLDRAAEAIVARAVPFPVDSGRYRVRLRFWP